MPDDKAAEIRFEYDQLRKEILQIDTLTLTTLGFILTLTGGIIAFSATAHGSSLMKGILFFVAEGIAFIGLRQSIDRGSSMYLLASYLRTFVEPHTDYIKWETRLQEFRDMRRDPKLKKKYGEYRGFTEYQRIIYFSLIIINPILGSWHILKYSSVTQKLITTLYDSLVSSCLFPILFTLVVSSLTLFFIVKEAKHYNSAVKTHEEYYTPIWKQVQMKEALRDYKKDPLLQ